MSITNLAWLILSGTMDRICTISKKATIKNQKNQKTAKNIKEKKTKEKKPKNKKEKTKKTKTKLKPF